MKDKKYECVIVDCYSPPSLFEYLDANNIKYIKSGYIKNTVEAVSTHPDMQLCYIGKGCYVCEPTLYDYYSDKLSSYNVKLIKGEKHITDTYPFDISYNVVVTGSILLHNLKYTDDIILKLSKSSGISIYNVKQGYTKCATCIIADNAFITSDNGIYNFCKSNNVNCLLVENDVIKLGSRNDGFIGGCCGKIGDNTLLFCGDITAHKSYRKIVDFSSEFGVKILSSSRDKLTDVGSIIPVIQE